MSSCSSSSAQVLIKDGAMGTELDALGVACDKAGSMWSSSVLLLDTDAVRRVHRAYFDAGCDVLLTCTYQMHEAGCLASRVEMSEVVDRAVQTVHSAMRSQVDNNLEAEVNMDIPISEALGLFYSIRSFKTGYGSRRKVFVAGSLGPYGSSLNGGQEYTGDYILSDSFVKAFHAGRLEAFVGQRDENKFLKVDFFLFETFPRLDEALVILSWVHQHKYLRATPVCFSFVLANVDSFLPPTANDGELRDWWLSATGSLRLPDGNTLEAAVSRLRQDRGVALAGIGCNCCGPLEVSLGAAALLRCRRVDAEPPLVLMLCPNSGETYVEGRWCRVRETLRCPATGEDRRLLALQRILAQGNGDLSTFLKFVLLLLQQRPAAEDWLFDVVICGACCRSTPDDVSHMKKEVLATSGFVV